MPYITYLRDPELHTNSAGSHPGWGRTKEEAEACALYWHNQEPWVVTVAASRAPRWAQNTAWSPRRYKLELDLGQGLNQAEEKELDQMRLLEIYGGKQ